MEIQLLLNPEQQIIDAEEVAARNATGDWEGVQAITDDNQILPLRTALDAGYVFGPSYEQTGIGIPVFAQAGLGIGAIAVLGFAAYWFLIRKQSKII